MLVSAKLDKPPSVVTDGDKEYITYLRMVWFPSLMKTRISEAMVVLGVMTSTFWVVPSRYSVTLFARQNLCRTQGARYWLTLCCQTVSSYRNR